MAIIIPSKKTYERQNPKVRDNVIERLEIGATLVKPYNTYQTTVYTSENPVTLDEENSIGTTNNFAVTAAVRTIDNAEHSWATDVWGKYYFTIIPSIKVYKQLPTSAITKIYRKDEEGKTAISYSYKNLIETVTKGVVKGGYEPRSGYTAGVFWHEGIEQATPEEHKKLRNLFNFDANKKVSFRWRTSSQPTDYGMVGEFLGYEIEEDINTEMPEKPNAKINAIGVSYNNTFSTPMGYLQTVTKDFLGANIAEAEYKETDEYFEIKNIKVFSKVVLYYASCAVSVKNDQVNSSTHGHNAQFVKVVQEAEEINISFLGDTIGIDLTDSTVYINGQTAKKVQSIDGNELMQTSNYWLETGENAIERAFSATQEEYANGKETATLRCSIGEYYGDKEFSVRFGGELSSYEDTAVYELFVSGDQKLAEGDIVYFKNHAVVITEVDEDYYAVVGRKDILSMYAGQSVVAKQLKISTKEKGVPMLFSEYDQVIPMKLGADGKDHPMSVYRDGTPKVFNVLSVHPYFDGAVWQELELQEIMKKV